VVAPLPLPLEPVPADVGVVVGAVRVSPLELLEVSLLEVLLLAALEVSAEADGSAVVLVVGVVEPVLEAWAAATATPPPTSPATATTAVAAESSRRLRSRSRTLRASSGFLVMPQPWRPNLCER
jgi:hypothetical protein